MLYVGTRLYGKVDHVPGLFFVATSFGHVNFLPIFPQDSFLCLDDGQGRNILIPMSLKSVLLAWLRAIGFVGGSFAAVGGAADGLTLVFVLGLVTLALTVASYWIFQAGRQRAAALAEAAKLDPTFVHDHFDRIEGRKGPRSSGPVTFKR